MTRDEIMELKGYRKVSKKMYISGPITGYHIEERRRVFDRIEEQFKEKGYNVFNPMNNNLKPDTEHWEYMKYDLRNLLSCDCVFFMKGFEKSQGCMVELQVATACNLEIFFEK